jgi:hypothetical protein
MGDRDFQRKRSHFLISLVKGASLTSPLESVLEFSQTFTQATGELLYQA